MNTAALLPLLLLLGPGCDRLVKGPDRDGDGWRTDEDCDDGDPALHPEQLEDCDGLDNDCDGDVDERDGLTVDKDGDGYGYDDGDAYDCDAPYGWSAKAGDCDDWDAGTSPGAEETCDGTDEDCDGEIDEDLPTVTCYPDLDGDRTGDPDVSWVICGGGCGEAAAGRAGDCDDQDPSVSSREDEICNGVDDDCDGEIDEGYGEGTTWYRDEDGDGYGNAGLTGDGCSGRTHWVADGTDCDDSSSRVNPGESEACNGVDDDCDGETDEGFDPVNYYYDWDGDGFGDPDTVFVGCDRTSSGLVTVGTDCDDTDGDTHPGAPEDCDDGDDTDCDGLLDCEDDACERAAVCAEGDCSDGRDADLDGRIDCQDDECWGDPDCPTVVAFRVTNGDRVWHWRERIGAWQRSTCYEATTYQGDLHLCDEWKATNIEGTLRVYAPDATAPATCRWGLDEAALRDCTNYHWNSRASRTTTYSLVSDRDDFWITGDCGIGDDGFLPPLTSVADRWFSWYQPRSVYFTSDFVDYEGWWDGCWAENHQRSTDTAYGYCLGPGTRDTYTIGTTGD